MNGGSIRLHGRQRILRIHEEEMMTEEEWNRFEMVAESLSDPSIVQISEGDRSIIAAYQELKERREDEEWLLVNVANNGATIDTKFLHRKDGSGPRDVWELRHSGGPIVWGETLHAAVSAARGK